MTVYIEDVVDNPPPGDAVPFIYPDPVVTCDPTFFRMFQHLLPRGRSWNLTPNKTLRNFFEGLSCLGADIKTFTDKVWFDILPQTTREVTQWEQQFGLTDSPITEQQRRDRLDGAWAALGGQSVQYLQTVLQSHGFDVYLHEWWVPGTEPAVDVKQCVTPRDPHTYLTENYLDADDPVLGYPLVNVVLESAINSVVDDGDTLSQCGEPTMQCGNYDGINDTFIDYTLPTDPTKWSYFLYIGGETFPAKATVEASRRQEFEALCLKYCPAQNWLGIIVNYV